MPCCYQHLELFHKPQPSQPLLLKVVETLGLERPLISALQHYLDTGKLGSGGGWVIQNRSCITSMLISEKQDISLSIYEFFMYNWLTLLLKDFRRQTTKKKKSRYFCDGITHVCSFQVITKGDNKKTTRSDVTHKTVPSFEKSVQRLICNLLRCLQVGFLLSRAIKSWGETSNVPQILYPELRIIFVKWIK